MGQDDKNEGRNTQHMNDTQQPGREQVWRVGVNSEEIDEETGNRCVGGGRSGDWN